MTVYMVLITHVDTYGKNNNERKGQGLLEAGFTTSKMVVGMYWTPRGQRASLPPKNIMNQSNYDIQKVQIWTI